MARYYVNRNAQNNGDHEVHRERCEHMPYVENRIYLGNFDSCGPAKREAKKYYDTADGCYYCCNACHTG